MIDIRTPDGKGGYLLPPDTPPDLVAAVRLFAAGASPEEVAACFADAPVVVSVPCPAEARP